MQKKDEIFLLQKERGEQDSLAVWSCILGGGLFSSELCGSLRDVAVLWVIVFVGYSEYFSNSFYLRKDCGACRFLNIQLSIVDNLKPFESQSKRH